ncbi:hypothetical protein [Streptomyces sp. NPDC048111]|uniref:hypothetical protein n=1 Tax=Streptomyces sp. NPDC048111 TaxID=3365500 RepID=UPI003717BE97
MIWCRLVEVVLEQCVQGVCGVPLALGLSLFVRGVRSRSDHALCTGGVLVLLVVLAR